ncbi:4739_t:CDS:2 [Entrophospora sp. SA101]|nr:4739_t:CDS:2 [Entrophospora sp. SA101]
MKESVETITQCEIEQRQQQSQQLQNQKNDFKNFNNSVNKIQRKNIDIPHINKLPVKDVLKKIISSRDINNNDSEAEHENAFFVADLVLKLLSALGTGFDCASKSEIQTILDLGVDPSRIIYANPCKQASFIRFASEHKVKMMTFDNVEELYKIKNFFPDAQLVLRILTDDSKSLCKLGLKFGASLDSVELLLQTAKDLDLNVIGVSFHVGSGCYDENAFVDAVYRAKYVFDKALNYGFNFTLLDVGGGFSHVHQSVTLSSAIDRHFPVETNVRIIAEPGRYYVAAAFTIATHIIARRAITGNQSVDKNDNVDNSHNVNGNSEPNVNGNSEPNVNGNSEPNVNGNSEPNVNGNSEPNVNGNSEPNVNGNSKPNVNGNSEPNVNGNNDHEYEQNDKKEQKSQSTNNVFKDSSSSVNVQPKVLVKDKVFVFGKDFSEEPHFDCSIWGPTCDSIDCVKKKGNLPKLLQGDWLYFEEMGAYTVCAASKFNGFRKSTIEYTTTDTDVFNYLSVYREENMKGEKRGNDNHDVRSDDKEEKNKRLKFQ